LLDDNYVSRDTWTDHDNYPAACGAGQFVIQIGDTLTCATPAGNGFWINASPWSYINNTMNKNLNISGVIYVNATNGTVGIGTDDPQKPLHIYGDDPDMILDINGSSASNLVELRFDVDGTDQARVYYDKSTNNFYLFYDSQDTGIGNLIFTKSGAGAEVMTLDNYSNVGIGTTTPSTKLDVDSGSNTEGLRIRGTAESAEIADFYVGAQGQLMIDVTDGTDSQAYIDLRSEDNQFGLIIRESNGTGIGTYANLYVTDAADDWLSVNLDGAKDGDALVVTASDRVGIGTSTPTQKLHVEGSVNITSDLYIGGNITSYGADFAEYMNSEQELVPGDVVCMNDEMNIEKCTEKGQMSVVGVVSENPTITGNAANGNVPVGIVGILTTKVKGPINSFDMITTSADGYAEKASAKDFGAIIGKAMEPCENKCLIKVLVGLS